MKRITHEGRHSLLHVSALDLSSIQATARVTSAVPYRKITRHSIHRASKGVQPISSARRVLAVVLRYNK
eukprot:1160418-Pelagomonas_calceolata.AAC.5